jgi:hypothetical protein
MAKSSRIIEDIDEAAMLQSIYERDNPPAASMEPQVVSLEPTAPKPDLPEKTKGVKESKESARRKRSNEDYSSSFLQHKELKTRSCVYISQKVHETILKIVRVIADKEVTVGGYIDNVLLQHLEDHRDEINDLYKRERNDLIEF